MPQVHLVDRETYLEMADAQDYACAVCGHLPAARERKLAVDHDHVTGQVRGLLCTRCNIALGYFRDDAAALRRAADYLDGRPWCYGSKEPAGTVRHGLRSFTWKELVEAPRAWSRR